MTTIPVRFGISLISQEIIMNEYKIFKTGYSWVGWIPWENRYREFVSEEEYAEEFYGRCGN